MNGISHQQAIKWIHRRLDGLLTENQALLLDQHLNSCPTCSAYAKEISLLPTYLQSQFHDRWEKQSGPSERVFEQVTTKARSIPGMNRLSSGARLVAGLTALLALGFLINFMISQLRDTSELVIDRGTTSNPPLVDDELAANRLLAFVSGQSGNSDIYIMRADGTGRTNLTNNPAKDSDPFWSPDGKRIVFMSDRGGSTQIYLMDADGSNLIQLTDVEGDASFDGSSYNPWSPNGRKLIVLHEQRLYVLDIADKSLTTLTAEPGQYLLTTWAPDGNHIAFAEMADPNRPNLFMADSGGTHLTKLTENLHGSEVFLLDYYWSQDGKSLIFIAPGGTFTTIYSASSDGSRDVIYRAGENKHILDWWNGTALWEQLGDTLIWLRPDGSRSTFDLCPNSRFQLLGTALRRSPSGNLAIASNCAGDGWTLYWANPDGTMIQQLLNSPLSAKQENFSVPVIWSADDHYIAFVSVDRDAPEWIGTLYVIDVAKAREDPSVQPLRLPGSFSPSWQPILSREVVEEESTPDPDPALSSDDLVAFASEGSGNLEIYTMHLDGSGMTNITNHPANDYSPAWSPDGTRIAFVSNRGGNDDIYVMNADGSALTRITEDPAPEMVPVWSPDGTEIAYASRDPDTRVANLYVSDSNGENRRRLREDVPEMVWPETWSPDSRYLFFLVNGQVFRVDVTSGETTTITADEDVYSQFVLSKDGARLLYLSWCGQKSAEFCSTVKSTNADGTDGETHATVQLPQVCTSGEPSPSNTSGHYEIIKWSPDRTRLLFAFYCEGSGGWFYIANADGSDFKPLTSYPILYEASGYEWAPDSQSIIFSTTLDSAYSNGIYLLNIDDALQDPTTRPTPVNASMPGIASFAWQPVRNTEEIREKPTPVVTSSPQTENSSLIFASIMENGNPDIYTVHADGSGLTNLTNHPAYDDHPFWSPDGARIAFESNRSGSTQIYVMDADGSDVIQVTDGDKEHRFEYSHPWSPDGNRLIITESEPFDPAARAPADAQWTVFVVDVDGQNKTPIAAEPGRYTVPSWSPDASHIGYVRVVPVGEREMARIFVVDASGNNLTNVARLLPDDEDIHTWAFSWTQGGRAISFVADRVAGETYNGRSAAYEASLDGATLVELGHSSTPMLDWHDGTAFTIGVGGESPFTWLRSDGTYSTLNPLENCETSAESQFNYIYSRSQSGDLLIGVNCPNSDLWLYRANRDGTVVKPLLNSPIAERGFSILNIVWSDDARFAALNLASTDKRLMGIYIVDVQAALRDPSQHALQIMTGRDATMYYWYPAWQPAP